MQKDTFHGVFLLELQIKLRNDLQFWIKIILTKQYTQLFNIKIQIIIYQFFPLKNIIQHRQ